MKSLLLSALTFLGFAICAPQAEARDYGRNYSGRHYSSGRHYNHGYYRGHRGYAYRSHGYYRPSYYRSSYYYPRARYYAYPRYYSSYYGGCGYPRYYGYGPRFSVSFGF